MDDVIEVYGAITMLSELIKMMSDPKLENVRMGVDIVIDILIKARDELQEKLMTETLNSIKQFVDNVRDGE